MFVPYEARSVAIHMAIVQNFSDIIACTEIIKYLKFEVIRGWRQFVFPNGLLPSGILDGVTIQKGTV
jgi:hypothetical protein